MLEVGSGASPLVSVAALRAGARLVVATDGSLPALQSLANNLSLNATYAFPQGPVQGPSVFTHLCLDHGTWCLSA